MIYLAHHNHAADKDLISSIMDMGGGTAFCAYTLHLALPVKSILWIQHRAEISCFIQMKHPSP